MALKKQRKAKDAHVRSIEKKFGVTMSYETDAQMHKSLVESGVPSLSKLLKMIEK